MSDFANNIPKGMHTGHEHGHRKIISGSWSPAWRVAAVDGYFLSKNHVTDINSCKKLHPLKFAILGSR
jgi:hypothetical protein